MAGYGLLQTPPTEEEIILNSRLAQLYNHEFEHGRFFQVVFENEHEVGVRLSTRTLLKVVYIKDKEDIEGIELIKLVDGRDKQRVKFCKFNLQQLKMFLQFISSIDLKGVSERRIALAETRVWIISSSSASDIFAWA